MRLFPPRVMMHCLGALAAKLNRCPLLDPCVLRTVLSIRRRVTVLLDIIFRWQVVGP